MSTNNDSTLPSPLGPVDTMPSQLGSAEAVPRQRHAAKSDGMSRYVWLGALVAGAYLLVQFLAP